MWRLFKDRNQMKRNAKEGKQGTELKMKWGEDLNRIIKKEEEKRINLYNWTQNLKISHFKTNLDGYDIIRKTYKNNDCFISQIFFTIPFHHWFVWHLSTSIL